MSIRSRCFLLLMLSAFSAKLSLGEEPPPLRDFVTAPEFNEQIRWSRLESGVRVFVSTPTEWRTARRELIIYATPNGSTIEQTLGCAARKDQDWRYDIQHVAAQTRRYREVVPDRDAILVVVQATQLSWPTFRASEPSAGVNIRDLVHSLQQEFTADRVTLTGHSGGGSFLTGYLNAIETIPAFIDRIAYLDSNYSYSDEDHHGDKLLTWLKGDRKRRLIVLAYDDREITLNGKKVVGPKGGTFRASQRMLQRFRQDGELQESMSGAFQHFHGQRGQIEFDIHPNPENKILHTALVGEMNGLLHALTLGTPQTGTWGEFGGPRAYAKWIAKTPLVEPVVVRATIPDDVPTHSLTLPTRPMDAPTGTQFRDRILSQSRGDREAAVLHELKRGNIPSFLRDMKPVRVTAKDAAGKDIEGVYFVTTDYLAVGTDDDFFRIPMTPSTAVAIAKAAGAALITRKISDDIHAVAELKLNPKPLTEHRDTAATFWQHHTLIEEQCEGQPRSLLTAGIKKDVVWTNRLRERPHKVAIYGWHYPDGRPIQTLYVGHVDWYVDYSHGVRLIAEEMLVDGTLRSVTDVLRDPRMHVLLSDEGPLDVEVLHRLAQWPPLK